MEHKTPLDPVIAEQLKRAMAGKVAALKFTLDGEQELVYNDKGEKVETPVKEEELGELPSGFGPEHHEAMAIIFDAITQIKVKLPKRQVPLTREEIVKAVSKKELRQLEDLGFIRQRILALVRNNTGKSVGGRAVIYFTPKGRAYVRERIQVGQDGNGVSGSAFSAAGQGGGDHPVQNAE